jgi:tetratricopeptide (TPR) repeat protein
MNTTVGRIPPDEPDRDAERQLHAQDSDSVYQSAGNQYFFVSRTPGRPPVPVANTLLRDIPAFTGRTAELESLSAAVTTAHERAGALPIYAIDGMPGVGKSALAIHAAHLLREHFPGGQLFVDLHAHSPTAGPVSPVDVLSALLAADGVHPGEIAGGLDARAAQWRARMAGRRVLLIMDDAAGQAQVAPLLPGAGECLVIVTSRRRLTGLSARHATVPITLDTLPPPQAAALFTQLIHRPLSPAESRAVDDVVRLCGYLPMAISLLAARLRPEPRWTVVDLRDNLAAAQDRLAQMRAEDIEVAAAFGLSYRNLPAARRRFFRRLGLHPGPDVDAYAAAALDGTSPVESRRHLEALYQDHLVEQPELGRYRMHDLIAEHARGLCAKDPPGDRVQAVRRLLAYYLHTASRANRYLDPRAVDTTPGPAAGTTAPPLSSSGQAVAWLRRETPNLFACIGYAQDADSRWITGMSTALAAYLGRSGPWHEAMALHRAARDAALARGDCVAYADALRYLGILHGRANECEPATAALREAIDGYRREGDRRREADALSQLGIVLRLSRNFPEATRVLQQALRIHRESRDPVGEAMALNGLSVIHWMTDNCPGAADALEAALAIYSVYDDPLGRADAYFRLGIVQRMLGDLQVARRASEQALALYEELGDRLGEANVRHSLGVAARIAGDYPAAMQALRRSLAIYEQVGDRFGQAHALKHLGAVQASTGYPADAEETLSRALVLYEDVGDAFGRAEALCNLGTVRRLEGDRAGAARLLEESLRISREIGNRLVQAQVLNENGILLLECGDVEMARDRHELALRLAREVHCPLEEARALEGIAQCALRESAGNAPTYLRDALTILRRIGAAEAARIADQLSEVDPAAAA